MLNFTNNGKKIANVQINDQYMPLYCSESPILKNIQYVEENDPLRCPYCDRIYSTKHHKKRHYNTCAAKYSIEKQNISHLYVQSAFPVPNLQMRDCIYIAGPAGAGKSTWCRSYIEKFHELKPDYDIYIISSIPEDSVFTGLPFSIQQLLIDEIRSDIRAGEPLDYLNIENFRKSLIIFDDIEYRERNISEILMELLYDCIQNGRDHTYNDEDIYLLITSHKLTNYRKTRLILDEATGVVVFPNSQGKTSIIRYADRYLGLGKKQIVKMLNTPARWLYIAKSNPPHLIYNNCIRTDIPF